MATPLIGISTGIEKIRDLINHVSDTGFNVIITGETGSGKEVVARNLYEHSPRMGKPFIKVNCAAVPDGLLESELYGHEQGAFTGADKKRRGKFELANKGVLFLDEIGDMSMPLQAKLLHVLQSGEFAPLGSEKEHKTDTWVIAATNHNLSTAIEKKKFRPDLYYRLNTINIDIPPLRERPEDIRHLINHYLDIFSHQFQGKKIKLPDERIINKLVSYHWPGNVRQLQNVLKRMIIIGNFDEIISELFVIQQYSETDKGEASVEPKPPSQPDNIDLASLFNGNIPDLNDFSLKEIRKKALDKIEHDAISYVLSKTEWNRSKASKILKISYKTLLYKISDLNIVPPTTTDFDN